jgi:spermidine synthase
MCTQPCYFGGPFALNWASDEDDHLDITQKKLAKRQEKRGIETRYWTPAVHLAAFALPRYAETVVRQAIFDGRNDRAARNGRGKNKNDKKTRA